MKSPEKILFSDRGASVVFLFVFNLSSGPHMLSYYNWCYIVMVRFSNGGDWKDKSSFVRNRIFTWRDWFFSLKWVTTILRQMVSSQHEWWFRTGSEVLLRSNGTSVTSSVRRSSSRNERGITCKGSSLYTSRYSFSFCRDSCSRMNLRIHKDKTFMNKTVMTQQQDL